MAKKKPTKDEILAENKKLQKQLDKLKSAQKGKKQLQSELEDARHHFQAIMENALDGIIIAVLKTGQVMYANKATSRILEYKSDEILGKKFTDFFADEPQEQMKDISIYDGVVQAQEFRKSDGSLCFVDISAVIINWLGADAALFSLRDVTEKKQAEERILFLSLHDNLTGLPNRNLFVERLKQALALASRHEKKVALLYVDLDKFKPINDTLGHKAGDTALITAARRMKSCIREVDTVARVGGDEFVIILQDIVESEGAVVAAQKVIEKMTKPFKIKKNTCALGASIGISIFPDHGQDVDTLMKNADQAMYAAKKIGGNNCRVFKP